MTEGRPTRLDKVKSTWSMAGTTVAVIASAVALTFTLWPSLSPDPGTGLAATMSVQAIDPAVEFGAYLKQYDLPMFKQYGPNASAILGTRGFLVYVRVQIQGKKHSSVRLDEVSYDWTSRQEFDRNPVDAFRADTPNDQWIVPVFIIDPDPTMHRNFFVRVRLSDSKVMLAFADSPRIKAF